MIEEEYREFRRRALPAVARSVVRDPPTDAADGPDARGDPGGSTGGGGDAAEGGEGEPAVVVRLHPAVRAYLEAEFDDRFGEYDPRDLASAVPAEVPDPETSATVPLEAEAGDEADRGRLLAYRTVRADLLSELARHADELGAAIEVHEALERLVGERGPPRERRPVDVVSEFLDWVAASRGEAAAESLRGEFTVLHVMRIAPLYGVDDDGSRELAASVREFLAEVHPEVLGSRSVAVER